MKKSYLKHIISLLMFGINGIVAANIALESYQIVLFRTLLGSAFLLAVFLLTKRKFSFFKHKKDLLFITLSGISMGASWMLLYEGFASIGVSLATLIYYSGPVIVIILSPFLFGERLTAPKICGFFSVALGVFLINGVSSDKIDTWGIICGILAAVTYALMVMANKKAKNIVGMENTLIQLAVGFITVALFVCIKDGGFYMQILPEDILWILLLGIVTTGLGCYLFFSSMGEMPMQSVALLGYLEPLSALIFSALLLGERLSPLQLVGGALIIGGAAAGELIGTKRKEWGTPRPDNEK